MSDIDPRLSFKTNEERDLWRMVFETSVRAGVFAHIAIQHADSAVLAYRARATGLAAA